MGKFRRAAGAAIDRVDDAAELARGVVELGGRVIPATQGYRAAYARVAVILLIDEVLTEPHSVLRKLAAAYSIPAVVPHSADPEDYREIAGTPSLAAETEEWLRGIGGNHA